MKKLLHEEMLQKEMTRKQFIQLLTVAIVSILGLNNLLSFITRSAKSPKSSNTASHGFGSSKFGV